jgi:hypothetical protein
LPPDGIHHVGDQPEVQHLLDEDTADQRERVRVPLRIQRIERTEIGRQRCMFELNCPLQVLPEIVD